MFIHINIAIYIIIGYKNMLIKNKGEFKTTNSVRGIK